MHVSISLAVALNTDMLLTSSIMGQFSPLLLSGIRVAWNR